MTTASPIAIVCAAGLGAVVGPIATACGLRELRGADERRDLASVISVVVGAAGGGVSALAASHAGSVWWFPALLVWSVILTAAATVDGYSQRIPTHLIRVGGLVTLVLVVGAGVLTHDWRALVLTAIATAAAGAVLVLCWRFAGAGFGDVRLATFGGLGLGHTTHHSLSIAVAGFAVVCAAQATWKYERTHDRKAHLALGPALAIGFLLAAAV